LPAADGGALPAGAGFLSPLSLWALALPLVAVFYLGCTLYSAWAYYRGRGACGKGGRKPQMTEMTASDLASGKDHKGENFPVASWLVRPDARAPIMAYYRFARASDDVADDESTSSAEKLRLLAHMRAGLEGKGAPEAMALGDVCRERGIDLAHAHDLLDAFVQDCRVNRYEDWDGLIGYCRLSAMPVGRFVLDVHGEDRATWAMNDALCAAQIINHLQDCGKDYRGIDRVYIPVPMLNAVGLDERGPRSCRSGPAGRDPPAGRKDAGLLRQSAAFPRDPRRAPLRRSGDHSVSGRGSDADAAHPRSAGRQGASQQGQRGVAGPARRGAQQHFGGLPMTTAP
jgi:squalene synthase HpnC